jgi:predicted double-glycine peptidase
MEKAKGRIDPMKKISIMIAAVALTLAAGCKNQATTATSSTDNTGSSTVATSAASSTAALTPEQLGELGATIKKSPDDAQKILSDRGLTTQAFEQQVRQVAQDPEASKRYAAAYKKAS